jgi:hypothetical protein
MSEPQNIKVRVKRLHPNNSTKKQRLNSLYLVTVSIIDRDTQQLLGRGMSRCSKHDTPNRKLGRELAYNRAVEDMKIARIGEGCGGVTSEDDEGFNKKVKKCEEGVGGKKGEGFGDIKPSDNIPSIHLEEVTYR